jgi:glycosyltransferase involved in cell wall biosynthesis
MKKRLAIVSSHPIQYNAPLFARLTLSEKVELKVFYTFSKGKDEIFDKDFGKHIKWDIPLFEGYNYEFVENLSPDPGLHHFRGVINPELVNRINLFKPDAILVYGWNYQSHLKVMRHFKGRVPVYFRGDSTIIDEKKGLKTLMRRILLRWVYSHADGAFYVGTNNKKYFLAHGIKEDKLFFAPHAIDITRFRTNDESMERAAEWRKGLGIHKHNILLLFAGKFEPKKDPVTLVKAFLQINNPALKIVLAGSGVLEDELRHLARHNNRVIFLPFQNQTAMPALYAMADIFVLTSKGPGETWGLAVNEAMAAGKPILVSDKVGCAADLVRNGYNGLIFKAGNLQDLVDKIDRMTSSKENLVNMGNFSSEMIGSWSYDEVCRSIEDKISQI